MSLLNVGSRALLANQIALQTTGHNISNVNTPGYSRQSTVQQTVQGQFTGAGYIGKGVDVQTILRNHSELLTRQATAAAAVDASDSARVARLRQLQDVFAGGASGLGAAINDMMNAFSSVVSAPTDLTARGIVLTRIDETAKRMVGASARLDEISDTVTDQLKSGVAAINQLAKNIAGVNQEISRAKGNGQPANDLLDMRDQLIRELNQHIQTTQVAADDGSVNVFVAGSQPLVMGHQAATLSLGDPQDFGAAGNEKRLFFQQPGSSIKVELNEAALTGGEVAGLLRFKNHDLKEGYQLLNRMAAAISISLNQQNQQGLTLDGQRGKPLFSGVTVGQPQASTANTSGASLALSISDHTRLPAASYMVSFDSATTGTITTQPGGVVQAFGTPPQPTLTDFFSERGFALTATGTPNANDRFLVDPLKNAAAQMQAQQFAPKELAAANPVHAAMGTSNAGSLQLASLRVTGQPPLQLPPTGAGVVMGFNAGAPATFTLTGNTGAPMDASTNPPTPLAGPPYVFTPGQPISIDGWEIRLSGTPKTGDTVKVGDALDPQYGDWYTRNAGNATSLMNLRDAAMFDGAALSDGFAGAMAQVGTRTQSAQFAAQLSASFAANLERDRTAVSGVNLDEEAARLIQYQQAYQASAKMIQIAQSIFDSLLQTVSR